LVGLFILTPFHQSKQSIIPVVIPLALAYIALLLSYTLLFTTLTTQPIAFFCVLASVALGLALGLSLTPMIVVIWNYSVIGTSFECMASGYYKDLVSDIRAVRAALWDEQKRQC
jgi:hypothetical protein